MTEASPSDSASGGAVHVDNVSPPKMFHALLQWAENLRSLGDLPSARSAAGIPIDKGTTVVIERITKRVAVVAPLTEADSAPH